MPHSLCLVFGSDIWKISYVTYKVLINKVLPGHFRIKINWQQVLGKPLFFNKISFS